MSELGPLLDAVTGRTGFRVDGNQFTRLLSLAGARSRHHGFADVGQYARAARDDGALLDDLVEHLRIGETYFFRDPGQTALLRDHVLPSVSATSGSIHAWSAGCASGEEAYTLAILGAQAGLSRRLRILGTDLSDAAVRRAEEAAYGQWSLRAVPEIIRRAWFEEDRGLHRVRREARAEVRFRRANLLDGPPGRFHLIVCRNVLIYLTPAAIRRAAEVFLEGLLPEGWLLTGASDPEISVDGLERVRTPAGMAYRRLRPPSSAPRPAGLRSADAGAQRTRRPRRTDRPSESIGPPTCSSTITIDDVRATADAGDRAGALVAARTALAADPLDADLRCLVALLHLDGADIAEALAAARAAAYLDPQMGAAHLVVAHCLRVRGEERSAARSYRTAARLLAALPPHAGATPGGTEPAAHLAALAAQAASTLEDDVDH